MDMNKESFLTNEVSHAMDSLLKSLSYNLNNGNIFSITDDDYEQVCNELIGFYENKDVITELFKINSIKIKELSWSLHVKEYLEENSMH